MDSNPFLIVAIDGGAAAGKSSTSRAISERFHFMHVDTGSFYRAVTRKLLDQNVNPEDSGAVVAALAALSLDTTLNGSTASITLNGWTPDESIRTQTVNDNVSQFAAIPALRSFLLDYQRSQVEVAKEQGFQGLVMEGRDIGSVIFPEADLRLFLFADPKKRAQRRAKEGIADSIEKRDKLDSSRKTAPLQCPKGATFLDTSELNLEEVVEKVSGIISELAAR